MGNQICSEISSTLPFTLFLLKFGAAHAANLGKLSFIVPAYFKNDEVLVGESWWILDAATETPCSRLTMP